MQNQSFSSKELPKHSTSLWLNSCPLPSFSSLEKDIDTDILIVGGGLTGITSAYLLSQSGQKVTLIEGNKLLQGTTGNTSAKITCQHSLIYHELINHFGIEKTRLYYDSNKAALEFIKKTAAEHKINCEFQEEKAYLYASTPEGEEKLLKEFEAYEKLSIVDASYHKELPIPIKIKGAISLSHQGQFNPIKYLSYLLDISVKKGVEIYEDTRAADVEMDEITKIITENGIKITAKKVIIATHFPFYEKRGMYFARMYADRSYILAIKPETPFPGGMYINVESPTRSLRSAKYKDEDILLVGGENHKTGQGGFTLGNYLKLKDFAESTFGIKEILFRWSAQDLITLDKLPYIGPLTSSTPNIFVATGFKKWGMTNGTAAAHILRDLVLGVKNPYEEVYTPERFKADPSLKNALSQNSNVAMELVKGKLESLKDNYQDLQPGEGRVISYKGKRTGAYKDENEKIYMVDTTCTHLGCELQWNSGEKTWDCPCHGSRFTFKGEVIEGPAIKPIEIINTEKSGS